MILKINKSELEIFEKNCASFQLQITSIETKGDLAVIQVLDSGREITLLNAYSLGRMTGMEKIEKTLLYS
jgi:hypothetical protein